MSGDFTTLLRTISNYRCLDCGLKSFPVAVFQQVTCLYVLTEAAVFVHLVIIVGRAFICLLVFPIVLVCALLRF